MNARLGRSETVGGLGILLSGGAVGWLLHRMRREVLHRGALTRPTVAAMYGGYAVHAGAFITAVAQRRGGLPLPRRISLAFGTATAGAGTVLVAAAMSQFDSPAHVSGMDDETLVTDGPYGYSRHPQYMGYTLVLVGAATAARSLPAAALAAGYATVVAPWARVEERKLEQQYGHDYIDYCRRTPRWLGRRRRRKEDGG